VEMRVPARRGWVVQRGVLHAREEQAVLRDLRVGDLQSRVTVARDADADIGSALRAGGLERLDLHQVSPGGFQQRAAAGRIGEFQEQDGQEFARVFLDYVRLEFVEHHGCVSCRALSRERLSKIKRHGFSSTGACRPRMSMRMAETVQTDD